MDKGCNWCMRNTIKGILEDSKNWGLWPVWWTVRIKIVYGFIKFTNKKAPIRITLSLYDWEGNEASIRYLPKESFSLDTLKSLVHSNFYIDKDYPYCLGNG